MLHYLKEVSQRMLSRTTEIEKQVDTLVYETKGTETRMNNVFNDFLMLANIQFVENRVWEESEKEEKEELSEDTRKAEEEQASGKKQVEITGRIKDALACGLRVLDDAFDKLEMTTEGDEDFEESYAGEFSHEPILEPKESYSLRSLPFLIGSSAFLAEDDIGLEDLPSDSDEDMGGAGLYESDGEDDEEEGAGAAAKDTANLFGPSDEELSDSSDFAEVKRNKAVSFAEEDSSGSSSGSEEEGSDESGSEEEQEEEEKEEEKEGGMFSFQDELTSKLKSKGSLFGDDNEDDEEGGGSGLFSDETIPKKEKKKKKTKKKKKKKSRKESTPQSNGGGGLFDEEKDELMEEDGSPFGKSKGLFSGGGGLFDEEDEEGDGGVAKAEKKSELEASIRSNKSGKQGFIQDFEFGGETPKFGVDVEGVL